MFAFRHARRGCLDGSGDNDEILACADEDYAYVFGRHTQSNFVIHQAVSVSTVDDEGRIPSTGGGGGGDTDNTVH